LHQVGYFAEEWYAALELISPKVGVAAAKFSLAGWGKPVMIFPDELPLVVSIFPDGSRMDLFRWVLYTKPYDLPEFMGGIERQRLDYVRMLEGRAVEARTVYVRPNRPKWIHEGRLQVLRLGPQRYDLLLERDIAPKEQAPAPDDIMHVPDLLAGSRPKAVKVGMIQTDSSRAAVPLAGNRMQLVWLDEWYLDKERIQPPVFRLMEAHLDGEAWSKPRLLFEGKGWAYDSLAATAFRAGVEEYVLAVWRGEKNCLTYTVGSPSGEWFEPVATKLLIGRENWVVSHGSDFTLVTKMRGNLYWCHFELTAERPGDRRGE